MLWLYVIFFYVFYLHYIVSCEYFTYVFQQNSCVTAHYVTLREDGKSASGRDIFHGEPDCVWLTVTLHVFMQSPVYLKQSKQHMRHVFISCTTESATSIPTNAHTTILRLWILSRTTRVSRYQKKHSPAHTYRGHQSSLICFIHLIRSMASSLFFPRA